jgi:hypothetical protein
MKLQMETQDGFPLCLARVDVAPPKPNQQWKGFFKTSTKTWLSRVLQIRDQTIMRKVKCYPSFILL